MQPNINLETWHYKLAGCRLLRRSKLCKQLFTGHTSRGQRKQFGQVIHEVGLYFGERHVTRKQFFQRGSFAVRNAARNDQVEVAQDRSLRCTQTRAKSPSG